ncbi:PREDICTED: uncharacterized protein LOC106745328 [Dinoponera quadriceps]|uniref:Uncharacterized protein LOC106745328 n=1 Tax=Dinoponera quadriceps TaxID=609295 RepID=A0A6P3XD38_DINQU|nr:PREDICTED: uncharacterized protein LOC106745328 [Dinoponera quadriceps]
MGFAKDEFSQDDRTINRYMMDLAANGLEKTSAVRREAMVSKLQNMQWLKNTSHPASPVRVKTHCKPRRGHEEDNKVEDKIPAMEDSNTNSAEESREYHLTVNTHMRDLSSDSMAKSDRNLQDKNMNISNIFPNAHVSIMQKAEEEGSSIAIQENLVTVQLENQCHVDKERKDQENVSQNALEDKTQNVTCPKFPESQEDDHDAKELDLTNDSDKNNNNAKLTTLDMSKASTSELSGNDKASVEPKDKDACMKKTLTSLKTNIKNASTTSLSKCCNDKPSTLFTNPNRSLSNLSKSPITDKSGRGERASGKHIFTKKTCPKDEFVRQHGVPTKGMENKTKDTAAKSGLPKADEKEPNKTADTSQSDQKVQSSSCPASSNKDKTSQVQQRITTKQFTLKSKGQESSRGNASYPINRGVDKNKTPDRTEKAVPACRNSDSPMRECERRSGEKNPPSDPKPYVATRNTTFVAQYKNSTLSRPAKTKNIESAPACGRNPLYARSNTTPDKERAGTAEYRTVAKMKRDCLPADASPSLDTRAEEPSNFESDVKQQRERDGDDAQPANAKSPETDASILNIDANGNSTGDKKPASVEDHARQVHVASGESCPNEKALDNDRTDQRPTDGNAKVDDEGMKSSKDSFDLDMTKSYAGSPGYPMSQHIYKPEDTRQQTQSQMRSQPVIWNEPSEPRSATSVQQFVQTEGHVRMREMDYGQRFYEQQRPPMSDTALRLPQIPNTFDHVYEPYNVTQPSAGDAATMFDAINGNRESSNRYTPNAQRPFTPLSDFPGQPASQISRWNLPVQDGFHIEQFANHAGAQPMHVYSAASSFAPDEYNAPNCLPSHPLLFTPCIQPNWNPQIHYQTPIYHSPPCTSYTVLPSVAGQSSSYNDVAAMCMHDQPPQHRYVHYLPASGNAAVQMHANPSYVKGMYEPGNTAVEDAPARSNRYYNKRYQDNCLRTTTYDVPQYATPATPASHLPVSRVQQQSFAPAAMNQYNVFGPPGQRYYKQNAMNYAQPRPKSPKKTQDLVCEDSSLEDIPPIISPKEFMTNSINIPNKTDQLPPRMFKQDFRMRQNTGYRQSSFQRYNGGFRKNVPCHDFPKEYHASSVGVGRGIAKTIQNTKM